MNSNNFYNCTAAKDTLPIEAGSIEVCPSEQEIRAELDLLTPIIDRIEFALDYGEKVSKEDYEKYEVSIARRTILTTMLGEDAAASNIIN